MAKKKAEEVKEEVVEEVKEPKKENKKTLVANTTFNDKYTGTTYDKGTEFVVVKEDVETTKISDKKYQISARRATEIKAKGYAE